MRTKAWRSVIVDASDRIHIDNNRLAISRENEEEKYVPLNQIREILITSNRGSISLPVLTALSQQNTSVIFCNDKYSPVCELCGYGDHFERAGRTLDQTCWTDRRKQAVWRQIVRQKIMQQIELLRRLDIEVPETMYGYNREVESGDATNREAAAGKLYFDLLFGREFNRFSEDSMNAALNYGYTILRSAFDRAIVLHGYKTEIGIHHRSRQNPYNLSCDLMEPFRPFVDEIAYLNIGKRFNLEYRKQLILLTGSLCLYAGTEMSIANAIEQYTLDVLYSMNVPRQGLKEVRFA